MSSTDSPSPSPAAQQPAPAAGPAPEPPAAEAEDQAARALLGKLKLNKVAAPPDLASRVPDLIQRRSAGRFFAKRRLADRLPLEWVSLVMLALLALIYAVLRMAPALLPAN
jgi:type VI protein secretion system component VasF